MYINSTTSDVYGPKASGVWGSIVCNIKGATGAAGTPGYSPQYIVAAGPPTSGIGNNGDMYINSSTSDVYGPKTAGAWGAIACNIKGSTGSQGPPGVAYTPRGAWSSATTYAQGDEVTYASNLYISLQSSNLNNTPSTSPTYWQPVGTGGSPQTPWASDIDGGNHKLYNVNTIGIGTTSPGSVLTVSANATALPAPLANNTFQMAAANGSGSELTIDSFGAIGNTISGRLAGGTNAAKTALPSGQIILNIRGLGYGATGYSSSARGRIALITSQAWTDTAQGTLLTFAVTPNGTVTPTEAVRIDQSGNVGIGTASPPTLLSVAGTVAGSFSGATIANLNATTGSAAGLNFAMGNLGTTPTGSIANVLESSSQAGLAFSAYNSGLGERVRITAAGNVGIGTASPAYGLVVANASGPQMQITDTSGTATNLFLGAKWINAQPCIGTNSASPLQFVTNNAVRMWLDVGGNIGINQISPQKLVHVTQASCGFAPYSSTRVFLEDSSTAYYEAAAGGSGYAGYLFSAGSSLTSYIIDQPSSAGLQVYCTGTRPMIFYTNSIERMRISSAGLVGINKTPSYGLDIAGDCNLSSGYVYRINGVAISSGVSTQNAVTASRALGTTYQNTTGKPMLVCISVQVSGGIAGGSGGAYAQTDSANPPTTTIGQSMVPSTSGGTPNGTTTASLSFWVLPNNYYRAVSATSGPGGVSPSLSIWTEWY
jgi:hypothetical protein